MNDKHKDVEKKFKVYYDKDMIKEGYCSNRNRYEEAGFKRISFDIKR